MEEVGVFLIFAPFWKKGFYGYARKNSILTFIIFSEILQYKKVKKYRI